MFENEPTLSKIEDYDGKESKEKRSTVNKVILFCLLVGAIYGGVKYFFDAPKDYVGTPAAPGINTAGKF